MYPLDRRKLACHIYSLILSLRKTSVMLQVSHTTIARWLKNPDRKVYIRSQPRLQTKTQIITETIRAAVINNPFITSHALINIVQDVFGFSISRQLANNIVRKSGFSRKKARFFGCPQNLASKTSAFLLTRDELVSKKHKFVAVDETGFGRHGVVTYGYSPIGKRLYVQKKSPRLTTTSVVALVDANGIISKTSKHGSFNTKTFHEFLSNAPIERGTVILLDNVAFHKSRSITELANENGWVLLYTPPYSPWFNPIEGMFSIIKRHFYKHESIDDAFDALKSTHASAFFSQSFSLRDRPN